jgi:hypothetical protein
VEDMSYCHFPASGIEENLLGSKIGTLRRNLSAYRPDINELVDTDPAPCHLFENRYIFRILKMRVTTETTASTITGTDRFIKFKPTRENTTADACIPRVEEKYVRSQNY